jgi:hypothetical protein
MARWYGPLLGQSQGGLGSAARTGSIAYVFVLAGIIWVVASPLALKPLSYRNLLTYITMTAPPAVLYAIPVERFMTLETATSANIWFLAIVALWRVTLFWRYLKLVPEMSTAAKILSGIFPLAAIVFVLAMLNLEHAVFEIMGSVTERTSNDGSFAVVSLLAVVSFFAAPLLAVAWIVVAVDASRDRREMAESGR